MDSFARFMAIVCLGAGLNVISLHLCREIGQHPGPHGGGEALTCALIQIFVQCQGML